MKKLFILLLTLKAINIQSQSLVSKDGEPFLPESKDWGISIDATKFIKDANFAFVTNVQSISGKYFLDEKTAVRGGIRLGFNSWLSTEWVRDRGATLNGLTYPSTYPLKENKWTRTYGAVGLSGGIEKRRGKTKLQGIYGAEFGILFSQLKDKFTYGNKLNASSGVSGGGIDSIADAMTSPTFGKANNIYLNPEIQGTDMARTVERNSGLIFSVLARVFIGAEYFIIPKLSLGGEFGWGPSLTLFGRSKTVYESIGTSTIPGSSSVPSVKQTTFDGPFNRSFNMDNDNYNTLGGLSATLRINLYF